MHFVWACFYCPITEERVKLSGLQSENQPGLYSRHFRLFFHPQQTDSAQNSFPKQSCCPHPDELCQKRNAFPLGKAQPVEKGHGKVAIFSYCGKEYGIMS